MAVTPTLTLLLVLVAVAACGGTQSEDPPASAEANDSGVEEQRDAAALRDSPARLTARENTRGATTLPPGEHALGVRQGRDAVVYIPRGVEEPAPLFVFLHGAGGRARVSMSRLVRWADTYKFVALVPESRQPTWDAIRGEFGVDIEHIDRAMQLTFDKVRIDPRRIALGGHSDGASYALSLGRVNGDLFTALIGLSPGFIVDTPTAGRPPVMIIHGVEDSVLPISVTSRRIVPRLKSEGYAVTYEEFEGGHELTRANIGRSIQWWLRR